MGDSFELKMGGANGRGLDADAYIDHPPDRTDCRRLLVEASGDLGKIEAWNRMRMRWNSRSNIESWMPDLSDKVDPWIIGHYIVLFASNVEGQDIAVDLSGTKLRWAGLRYTNLKGVDFTGANLEGADLCGTILDKAKLSTAYLEGADLSIAALRETDLSATSLEDADLTGASLKNVDLRNTNLQRADLSYAILEELDLRNTNLKEAKLSHADLKGVRLNRVNLEEMNLINADLKGVDLSDARLDGLDMTECMGLVADGQSIIGTQFSPRPNDPYNIVRQAYTGPLVMFHLVFLTIFFVPYIARAVIWTVLSKAQSGELAQSTLGLMKSYDFEPMSVLGLVLGFGPGYWGTLAGVLSIVFVVYNILRGVMTWWLSQVRDAEERSDHLPFKEQYWWCYNLHRHFMRYVFLVAAIAFVYHMVLWMGSTVMIPKASGS